MQPLPYPALEQAIDRHALVVMLQRRLVGVLTLMSQEVRWHHWTNQAIFDESGCLVESQLVGHDSTEGVQAEQELRESETAIRELYRVTASQKLEFEERLQQMLEILKSMLGICTSPKGEPNRIFALHQCETFCQWGDAPWLPYGIHTLKSTSATLSATMLYLLCQDLEEMSKGGTTRTALVLENQLEAEYKRFKTTLQVE